MATESFVVAGRSFDEIFDYVWTMEEIRHEVQGAIIRHHSLV